MSNQTYAQHPDPDDELDLFELLRILARRKTAILSCVVVCVLAGATFAFLTPPVYEASIKLRIGQVLVEHGSGFGLLESAEELSSRALAQYGETVAEGVRRDRPFLKRANQQKGVPSTVELVAEGDTPGEASGLLVRVVEDIRKAHDATYQRNIKLLNERLDNLDVQRSALQQQFRDANALLEQLKQQNAVQASLVMLELGRISTSISELDSEKPTLSQRLIPPQSRPTALLGDIVDPAEPTSPKKLLILTLSVVMGLIGGIVLAFLAEHVKNTRRSDAGSEA